MAKKTSRQTKKKTTKPAAKSRSRQEEREYKSRKQMWAVILFAVGILLVVFILKKENIFHNLLFGLLGMGVYALPPLCIYTAVMAAKEKPMAILRRKLWQSGVLLLLISGTAELFIGLPPSEGVFNLFYLAFREGMEHKGGGMLGILFAGPLSLIGDRPIPQIIIIFALIVFVILVTGNTLMSIYYGIRRPAEKIGSAYNNQREKRRQYEEEVTRQQVTAPLEVPPPSDSQEFRFTGGTGMLEDLPPLDGHRRAIDIDISSDRTPEEFAHGDKPLEPITKDLAGAYLDQPMEPYYSPEEKPEPPSEPEDLPPASPKDFSFDTEKVRPVDAFFNPPHQQSTSTSAFTAPPAPPLVEEEPPSSEPPEPTTLEEEEAPPEDPLADFGVDYPVEYVSVVAPPVEEPEEEPEPERPHPLEDAIEQAGEEDVLRVVQQYLRRSENGEDTGPIDLSDQEECATPPVEIETFRADITQPLSPTAAPEDTEEPADAPEELLDEVTPDIPVYQSENTDMPADQEPAKDKEEKPSAPEPAPVKKAQLVTPRAKSKEEKTAKEKPQTKGYTFPPMSLLEKPQAAPTTDISAELQENGEKLVNTLESFGVKTKIINIARGPSVTRYELQPSPGVKISRITGLADDIALNLAAAGIRIEAPIPNKAAVGIEVPNKNISMVRLREVLDTAIFQRSKANIAMALGKDITGNITVADLATMPHLLIAGATGSGKSVCINTIIMSILYKYSPDQVKFLMIDPKVVELGVYNGIPHLLVPVVTDPRKASGALSWAVKEMLKRYKSFASSGVRDIWGYNRQAEKDKSLEALPQVVIVIDELSDLMMAAPAEVEDSICRLAQMARAAGMHLIIATQRPSVDVITGVIKANIPSRIAFSVSSQVDSRTILDMGGAEKLLGRGDMLFFPVEYAKPVRLQGCFVSDQEVEQVVDFVKQDDEADYDEDVADEIERLTQAEQITDVLGGGFDDEDELMPYAIQCIVDAGQASASLLQRRLKIGHPRASRIIDQMEERGIIGPFEGSKPREVLISKDQHIEMKLAGQDQPNAGLTPPSEETVSDLLPEEQDMLETSIPPPSEEKESDLSDGSPDDMAQ